MLRNQSLSVCFLFFGLEFKVAFTPKIAVHSLLYYSNTPPCIFFFFLRIRRQNNDVYVFGRDAIFVGKYCYLLKLLFKVKASERDHYGYLRQPGSAVN